MRYQYALTNRLGNRSSNQDRCAVRHGDDMALLVVADGMGGHDRGDLAAQVAVDTFSRAFKALGNQVDDPERFLITAMEQAHDKVVDVGMAQHPPIEPRTTCVACLVMGDRAWWAHVGDSRLYLLRDGAVETRTRDHAYVEELLQSGSITEEEARSHPMRNSVSQCLGGTTTSPDTSVGAVDKLQKGDCLLLCSDGLWSALPGQQLAAMTQREDLNRGLEDLAEEAEKASYPRSDNISAVVLRWLSHTPSSKAAAQAGAETRATGQDPLTAAIDEIERAIERYADELENNKK